MTRILKLSPQGPLVRVVPGKLTALPGQEGRLQQPQRAEHMNAWRSANIMIKAMKNFISSPLGMNQHSVKKKKGRGEERKKNLFVVQLFFCWTPLVKYQLPTFTASSSCGGRSHEAETGAVLVLSFTFLQIGENSQQARKHLGNTDWLF